MLITPHVQHHPSFKIQKAQVDLGPCYLIISAVDIMGSHRC